MNTSGLGEFMFAIPAARRDPGIELAPRDLIALALPQGQLFPPGDHFDYCNTGWVIAALIAQRVCDQPLARLMQTELTEPFGLTCCSFGGADARGPMLHGYIKSRATEGFVNVSRALSWAFGAGDGLATLDDLLDLFGKLNVGGTLGKLIEHTAAPVAKPYFESSLGALYGLGVERRSWAGAEVWGHPGSTTAYMTGTWIDLSRGVTVSTCVTRAAELPLSRETELLYQRSQLFAVVLNTAYALAADARHV